MLAVCQRFYAVVCCRERDRIIHLVWDLSPNLSNSLRLRVNCVRSSSCYLILPLEYPGRGGLERSSGVRDECHTTVNFGAVQPSAAPAMLVASSGQVVTGSGGAAVGGSAAGAMPDRTSLPANTAGILPPLPPPPARQMQGPTPESNWVSGRQILGPCRMRVEHRSTS